MKRLFKSMTAALVIAVLFSVIPFSADCRNLTDDVFRFHILANSDSGSDQALKLYVRDRVLKYTEPLFKSSRSRAEAERKAMENLQQIANAAQKAVYERGYNYQVCAELRNMHFDIRNYGDITMPSGDYDALRITIGEGKGHNWWCVMYPSLCVGAASDYKELRKKTSCSEYEVMTDKTVFRFKIVEYFQNICSFFS